MTLIMEKNETLLPKDYKSYEVEEDKVYTMLGNGKEEFAIKNRSFADIDLFFSNGISRAIGERLTRRPGEQVLVLDLAGGTESKAVRDIGEKYGNRVGAVNIDIAQNIRKGMGVLRAQGSALSIPLADKSMDIIYSRQMLHFLQNLRLLDIRLFGPNKHQIQVETVLREVARVLKPGGIAFLDDEEELSKPKSNKKWSELTRQLGIVIESHESRSPKAERKFPNFWNLRIRPGRFLVMRKG